MSYEFSCGRLENFLQHLSMSCWFGIGPYDYSFEPMEGFPDSATSLWILFREGAHVIPLVSLNSFPTNNSKIVQTELYSLNPYVLSLQ